jgi:hypothetical protein
MPTNPAPRPAPGSGAPAGADPATRAAFERLAGQVAALQQQVKTLEAAARPAPKPLQTVTVLARPGGGRQWIKDLVFEGGLLVREGAPMPCGPAASASTGGGGTTVVQGETVTHNYYTEYRVSGWESE